MEPVQTGGHLDISSGSAQTTARVHSPAQLHHCPQKWGHRLETSSSGRSPTLTPGTDPGIITYALTGTGTVGDRPNTPLRVTEGCKSRKSPMCDERLKKKGPHTPPQLNLLTKSWAEVGAGQGYPILVRSHIWQTSTARQTGSLGHTGFRKD